MLNFKVYSQKIIDLISTGGENKKIHHRQPEEISVSFCIILLAVFLPIDTGNFV